MMVVRVFLPLLPSFLLLNKNGDSIKEYGINLLIKVEKLMMRDILSESISRVLPRIYSSIFFYVFKTY